MRLGLDVDGVLANFDRVYQELIIAHTGKDLFQPGDIDNPPCWDWPEYRGYTKEEMNAVWNVIKSSRNFWAGLLPFSGMAALAERYQELDALHDIYFVTARSGARAKRQTENWLILNGIPWPTVLMASDKAAIAKALSLDAYIDDNLDNTILVSINTTTDAYLLDRSYNQTPIHYGFTRVASVEEFLALVQERVY